MPGVGQRLMDHPSISVSSFIKPEARLNDLTRRHILLALRYSSGIGGAPAGDMFVASVSKSAWHAVGEQIGSLLAAVYKTFSETGQVKLASRDWRAEPIVEFNLLSDRRDLERLMDAFRRLGAMQVSAALGEATSNPFPASYTEKVRKIGVVNARNKRITDIIARLLDGPAWLRRYVIEKVIVEGYRFDQLMRDDEALEDVHPQGRDRGVARHLHLPHGCRGRPDGGDRQSGPGARGRGPARRRRLAVPRRAMRQHQFPDPDDRRKDRRRDARRELSCRYFDMPPRGGRKPDGPAHPPDGPARQVPPSALAEPRCVGIGGRARPQAQMNIPVGKAVVVGIGHRPRLSA